MAGSTPIYGFPYPESSDLVANYPALGQDLAEDIEGVIAALPPGGLAHIATESFSAVSSVSLNGVFTSAYANYKITINCTASSAGGNDTYMRMRASGTDNTNNNYSTQVIRATGTGIFAFNNTLTSWNGFFNANEGQDYSIDIYDPQVAQRTAYISNGGFRSTGYVYNSVGVFTATTQFDGFTFYPGAGNITGTIRVYGYQNS